MSQKKEYTNTPILSPVDETYSDKGFKSDNDQNVIFVLTHKKTLCNDLLDWISKHQLKLLPCSCIVDALNYIKKIPPHILIIDVEILEEIDYNFFSSVYQLSLKKRFLITIWTKSEVLLNHLSPYAIYNCKIVKNINDFVNIVALFSKEIPVIESEENHHPTTSKKKITTVVTDEYNEFVRLLKKAILENMHKTDFNVAFLSKTFNLSQRSFLRKVKDATGKTAVNYIKSCRFGLAAELLYSDRYTAKEIMYKVGITNYSYFNKEFKKIYNLSPKNYRKKQQLDS